MQAAIVQILESADYQQEILRGAELLTAGKLIVLPTETVYGVAGLLSNGSALAALQGLRLSSQPAPGPVKPFVIHVAQPHDALQYLGDIGDLGRRMLKKLWPGPVGLTFEVPEVRRQEVADKLGISQEDIYHDGKITLRCPDHPVFFDVVSRVAGPVVLTSAGAGRQRADVSSDVAGQIEMILDAGQTRFSKPSTLLAIRGNRYDVVREGVFDERIIQRMLKTTILFVCSGNTCRSPMAEALARKYLADKLHVTPDELENTGVEVTSAGSYAMAGAKAAEPAVDVIQQMGADLSRHRSRPLTVELIHQADAIFTMTRAHAQAVTALVPAAADKTSPLDPDKDIEDPIGGDVSLYTEVAAQIKSLIERRLSDDKIV